jgi:hypothetical protein
MNVQFGAKFAVTRVSAISRPGRPDVYMAKNIPAMLGALQDDGFHQVEMGGANVHIRVQPTPFSNHDGIQAFGAAVSFNAHSHSGQQLLPAVMVKRGDEQTIYTGQDYVDEFQRLMTSGTNGRRSGSSETYS